MERSEIEMEVAYWRMMIGDMILGNASPKAIQKAQGVLKELLQEGSQIMSQEVRQEKLGLLGQEEPSRGLDVGIG